MTDYYPLISRAVAALSENTPQTRRAVYDRARAALLQQLRKMSPPMSEAHIARESLSLDQTIQRIEDETADAHALAREEALAREAATRPRRSRKDGSSIQDVSGSQTGRTEARPRLETQPLKPATNNKRTSLVVALLIVVMSAIAGLALWLKNERPQTNPAFSTQTPDAPVSSSGKFADRVDGPQTAPSQNGSEERGPLSISPSQSGSAAENGVPRASIAVAQRGILYEETEDPQKPPSVLSGTALWRLESLNGEQGQQAETVVHVDLDIPEAGLHLVLLIRRNQDPALPASHTFQMTFSQTDPQGAGRAVRDVGLPQLKTDESARGTPLAGLPVPVTENVFLIGLSSLKADVDRNIELLRQRSWIDIPLRFASGKRAVLAVEKGVSGDQAIVDALKMWQE